MVSDTKTKNSRGIAPLAMLVDRVMKPVFSKRNPLEARLITDWRLLAGPKIAACSIPKYIAFPSQESRKDGILHIEISNSSMATELVYMEPVLVEKIAIYLGYKAIAKLKLHLCPSSTALSPVKESPVAPALTPKKRDTLTSLVAEVEDAELKEVLLRLGECVVR